VEELLQDEINDESDHRFSSTRLAMATERGSARNIDLDELRQIGVQAAEKKFKRMLFTIRARKIAGGVPVEPAPPSSSLSVGKSPSIVPRASLALPPSLTASSLPPSSPEMIGSSRGRSHSRAQRDLSEIGNNVLTASDSLTRQLTGLAMTRKKQPPTALLPKIQAPEIANYAP